MAVFTEIINYCKSKLIEIKNFFLPRKSSKKELHQKIVYNYDNVKEFSIYLFCAWFFYILYLISSNNFFFSFNLPIFRIILYTCLFVTSILGILIRISYTIDNNYDHYNQDFFQKFYGFFENEKASTQKNDYSYEVLRLRQSAGNLIDFPNSVTLLLPITFLIGFLGLGFLIIQDISIIEENAVIPTIYPIGILFLIIFFGGVLLSFERTRCFLKNLNIASSFIKNYFIKLKDDIQVSITYIFQLKTISDSDMKNMETKFETLLNLYFGCTSDKDLNNKICQDFSKIIFDLEELFYWRELASKVIGKATLQSDNILNVSKIEEFRSFLDTIIKSRESKISMKIMKRNSILAKFSLGLSAILILWNIIQSIVYKK